MTSHFADRLNLQLSIDIRVQLTIPFSARVGKSCWPVTFWLARQTVRFGSVRFGSAPRSSDICWGLGGVGAGRPSRLRKSPKVRGASGLAGDPAALSPSI